MNIIKSLSGSLKSRIKLKDAELRKARLEFSKKWARKFRVVKKNV